MLNKRDRLYLHDVLESIEAIELYTGRSSFDEFREDRKTYSATIREFQIIGEAIGKISEATKQRYGTVLWQDIKDFRNKLVHEYFGVDLEIVWNTIQHDLPELKTQIRTIISQK